MALSHITAHHLVRTPDQPAKLSLRQNELTTDEHKQLLLDKLKSSFLIRLSRKHGSFDQQGEPPLLARGLEEFLADEDRFAPFTGRFMEQLKSAVDEKEVELNAHFLFFVEQAGSHHVFYLFGVSQSESIAISEQLEVTPSYAVDTGPSLFGIKVDLAEWKQHHNYAYLSLLPPRGNLLLSEIFDQLTGFANGIDTEQSTLAFLQGVDSFAKQLPEEQVNDYRNKVVDYCTAQQEKDEPINIPGLSKQLGGIDCDQFIKAMASHNPKGEDDVLLDRRSLKRYTKFSGRDKDLAISFSSSQLNQRVHYDPESDTLKISGLPKSLRNQLLKHLEENS